jgi:hypothetical protein
MSPSDDDPLACRTAKSLEDFKETSRVCQIGDDSGKGFREFCEGQSSIDKDIQGAETQPAMDGSEGQLLEDVDKAGPMVTSVCFPRLGVPVSITPIDDDPLVYQNAVFLLEREKALRPSRYTGDASQVNSETSERRVPEGYSPPHLDDSFFDEMYARANTWDLGKPPAFGSLKNYEVEVGGAQVTPDLLNRGRFISTRPPVQNQRSQPMLTEQEEVIVDQSGWTGCFRVRGRYQAEKDDDRAQDLKDSEHFLNLEPRFRKITATVKSLPPGPERTQALNEFWDTAYSRFQWSEREMLRIRGKVLSEYVGLLDEERIRRSLCERASGPSHVEDGGGDAQRTSRVSRMFFPDSEHKDMHRSSAVTVGPGSQSLSMDSGLVSGTGLTGTCADYSCPP